MLALLAQVVPDPTAADPSIWDQFGPFAICFLLLSGAIVWLLRERAKDRSSYDADIKAHRDQLDIERKANRELYDRIIEQQGHMAPLLEKTSLALEHVAQAAER